MVFTVNQKIRWFRLLFKGYFSRFESDTAKNILERVNVMHPTILDVGANIGLFSKAFANSRFKPKLILSFEPSTYVFSILKRVTKKYPTVRCFQLALSNKKGTTTLNMAVKPSGSIRVGLSHIGKTLNGEYLQEEVKTEALDIVLELNQITNVDLVKIDVEGAEGLVLEGAKNLLTNVRPIWFVEISDMGDRFQKNGKDVFNIFVDYNYVPHIYTPKGEIREQRELVCGSNYLFIPSEKT